MLTLQAIYTHNLNWYWNVLETNIFVLFVFCKQDYFTRSIAVEAHPVALQRVFSKSRTKKLSKGGLNRRSSQ